MTALVLICCAAFCYLVLAGFKKRPRVRGDTATGKDYRQYPVWVQSFSSSERYGIDPSKVECSCPDWCKRRAGYTAPDPRLLCKHLIAHYFNNASLYPAWLGRYREDLEHHYASGIGYPPFAERGEIEACGKKFETFRSNSEWLTIFDGTGRYAFNPAIGKWAYKKAPAEGNIIARVLMKTPADIPVGSIMTVIRRKPKTSEIPAGHSSAEKCLVVTATLDGETIEAYFNPRAHWVNVAIGSSIVDFNISDGVFNCDPHLLHLEAAVRHWVETEMADCRAAAKRKVE